MTGVALMVVVLTGADLEGLGVLRGAVFALAGFEGAFALLEAAERGAALAAFTLGAGLPFLLEAAGLLVDLATETPTPFVISRDTIVVGKWSGLIPS